MPNNEVGYRGQLHATCNMYNTFLQGTHSNYNNFILGQHINLVENSRCFSLISRCN
jgi:hypothetical protein